MPRVRDPGNYPKDDGICSELNLSYYIWYRGSPRTIGSLSVEELRGALLDAQNDLNLVCLRLYRAEEPDEHAVAIANRHRVTSEEEEVLATQRCCNQGVRTEPGTDGTSLQVLYPERKL